MLEWINSELDRLDHEGLRRKRRCVRPLAGGRCAVDGRELSNFAGNDYLDLAGDARVIAAATEALQQSGTGARASALVCGRTEWHERLEERLAAFEGTEAAILFPTGYAANVGTITALVGPGDTVFCDRLNHASLVDGCRLSGARFRVYPHCDLTGLERELEKPTGTHEARTPAPSSLISQPSSLIPPLRLIVTDSVFSMDGDLAPLPQLCDLAERHGAMLLVDEAHATGVFGARGRGVAELKGVEGRGIIRVGTLSKAIGAQGGFVCGPQRLIDWLWNSARTQMFSTALAPAACAAACAALDIIEREPERRARLLRMCDWFRSRLVESGIATPASSTGPIVPIIVGDATRTMQAAQGLEERGFLVGAIRPPTVPRGTSRLRISITAGHDEDALEGLARAVDEVMA
jgi:8-amino-7-oxononanoate synthase